MEVKLNHVSYNDIINDITYTFKHNKVTSIIGPSGCGKSTLLELIIALNIPTKGSIEIDSFKIEQNKKIKNINELRQTVGYIFQNSEISFFNPTVYDELAFGLKRFKYRLNKIDKQINDSLKIVGLNEKCLELSPHELSYGEKTKLGIAIALSLNPKILLLDEPTIGLDGKSKKNLVKLIKRIVREYDKTVIIASNDIDFVIEVSNEVIVMNNGKLTTSGCLLEVIKDTNIFKDNNIELPKIIEFINLVYNKKQIKLNVTNDIKELMKDVYRNVH